jgi:hypothetical protein
MTKEEMITILEVQTNYSYEELQAMSDRQLTEVVTENIDSLIW